MLHAKTHVLNVHFGESENFEKDRRNIIENNVNNQHVALNASPYQPYHHHHIATMQWKRTQQHGFIFH